MGVRIVDGDLFTTEATVICHQVNCQGRMGSGVAKQVRAQFPKVYDSYHRLCADAKRVGEFMGLKQSVLLGVVQMVEEDGVVICNMFAQDHYGYDGYGYTDYAAFEKCLHELVDRLPPGRDIAMPYKIGCGLGGGDWEIIYKMILATIGQRHSVALYRKEV